MSQRGIRKHRNIVIVAPIILIFFLCFNIAFASEITAQKMFELTNESRKEAGLKALNMDAKLTLAAKKKADDMFANQYFEHISPTGVTPWYWFGVVGYDYIYAAENLAIDFVTCEGAHSAFMKSTGHRENILGANYKDIGIAAVTDMFEKRETTIIVEEFGATKEENSINDNFFDETPGQSQVDTITIPTVLQLGNKENATKNNCASDSSCGTQPNKSNTKPKANKNVADKPVEINQDALVTPETTVAKETEVKPETEEAPVKNKPTAIENNKNTAEYGKIIPEIYSVKDLRVLKKSFTENIYWKEAEKNNIIGNSLARDRARLKSILKDLLRDHCCESIKL